MKNRLDTMQELFSALSEQNKELMLWIAKHMQPDQQSSQSEGSSDCSELHLPQ